MIPILYESNETQFTSNGLGRLRDCSRFEVTEERNGVYEAEFEMPINGAHFDLIQPGRIVLVSHDETGDLQPFDIYSYSRPLNGVVTFHARHISYRLNYCTAILSNINSLSDVLIKLNGATPSLLKPNAGGFSFSSDKSSVGYLAAADGLPHTIRQLMGGIEGSILDIYGGEYEFNRFNVNLWAERGQKRSFSIRYGVNLTEYNEDLDYGGAYNAVVPFWAGNEEKLIGNMVTNNLQSFDGRIDCVPLDLSDRWENKPTSTAAMENAARSWLASNKPNFPSQNIKINFVKLSDTEEYEQFSPLQTCGLCDQVKVIFPYYGIEGYYKIVKTVWDVLTERYVEMELGNLSASMADALGVSSGSGVVNPGASSLNLTKSALITDLTNMSMRAGNVAIISGYCHDSGNGLSVGDVIATLPVTVPERMIGMAWILATMVMYPIHIASGNDKLVVSSVPIPHSGSWIYFKITAVINS